MGIQFIPNVFEYFLGNGEKSKPFRLKPELSITTSQFIINFGVQLSILLIAILLYPIICFASESNFTFISKKMKKYKESYKFNFFLRFWIQSYLDIGIFAIFQILSVIIS